MIRGFFIDTKNLVYGILEIEILHFMHIEMQIGQEVLVTEKHKWWCILYGF